jgi:hypothetical protein
MHRLSHQPKIKNKEERIYSGEIEVEDNDFELTAKRLVVRSEGILVVFEGSDEFGFFKAEGEAKITEHGFYLIHQLPLVYSLYGHDDLASIRIHSISFSKRETRCRISGRWIQSRVEWNLRGNLKQINSSCRVR